jgi:uncharacterized protein YaiL (DUF2058 family)
MMVGVMANFRDQLLRAGLVDKKTKQQADTSARRNRKKKGKKKKGTQVSEEERQRQAHNDRLAAEAQENRNRAAARNQEIKTQEIANQAASLVKTSAVREPKPGSQRFCFVSRGRKIRWFDLTAPLARKLELGLLAIVESPGDKNEPFALVPADIAARMEELDPELVRFWNREPVGAVP